tara:strand:- start:78 stop:341 length:264 start_codon:yes stop_codon:yes gene_type:complete
MSWRNILVFVITTCIGFFIGKWITQFISWTAPQYFNIDPGFIKNWLSKKPSLSSNLLGYIIYATTALVMFFLSTFMTNLLNKKKSNN